MEGLTIMLMIVFINLLYTHIMPNNHYCSTCMMSYPHLMAKHYLKVGRKSKSEAWNLPTSDCKSMWKDLQSCWECSSTCYTPIQCQTTNIVALTWWHTPTWWPNIAWKSAENQNLRHETRQHVAVKVWWVDLQSCWECSSTCYIHLYIAKQPLFNNLHAAIPPLDGQTLSVCWQKIEIWGMKPANMWL